VLAHDASEALASIQAPTLITYGRHDIVTSTRFAKPLSEGIADSEVHVFENCAHAAIYEDVEGFNERTLNWLQQHSG
jgi:2-hydroxy-6-oxonona-2,4-dienedioate hydrolase